MRHLTGLLALLLLAGAAFALREDDPFRVESEYWGRQVPYEPDRLIRMKLHDWVRSPVTTGRYTTFEVPMNYLNPARGVPGGEPPSFRMLSRWAEGPDGRHRLMPGYEPEGATQAEAVRIAGGRFSTMVSAVGSVNTPRLNGILVPARQSGRPFPGYAAVYADIRPGRTYWMGFEYCGFDAFEYIGPRDWMLRHDAKPVLDAPPPEGTPEPFDRARVFGWPGPTGVIYEYIAHCRDVGAADLHCQMDAFLNEWVFLNYYFDESLLCEMPAAIAAHRAFLRERTVEEQDVITNPELQ